MTLTDRESSSSPSRASSEGSSVASETSRASNPTVSETDQDDVVDPVCLEWFKDVIRKIKGQKQRPGLDRMLQALKPYLVGSKYNGQSIKKQLGLAIRDGNLFKVWSNGEPSYKDTENLRSLRKLVVKGNTEAKRAVKAAVREIGEKDGTDAENIQRYIKFTFEVKLDPDALKTAIAAALKTLTKNKQLIEQNGRYKHSGKADLADEDEAEGSRPRSSHSATPRQKDHSEEIQITPPVSKTKSKKTTSLGKADLEKHQVTPVSTGSKRSTATPASTPTSKSSGASKKKVVASDEKTAERHKSATPITGKLDNSLKRKKSQSPEKKSEKLLPTPSQKPLKTEAEQKAKNKESTPASTSKSADSNTGKSKVSKQKLSAEKTSDSKKRGRPTKKKPGTPTAGSSPARAKTKSVEKEKEKEEGETSEDQIQEKSSAIFPDPSFDEKVPKELKDGLSSYFSLSTVKRKSRVAYNSLLTAAVPVNNDGETSEDNEPKPSTSRQKSPPTSRQSLPSTSRPKSPPTSTVSRSKPPSASRQKSPARRQKSPVVKTTTFQDRIRQDLETPTDSGSDIRRESESRERDGDGKEKKGRKRGSMQLKGLNDQLSRYFTAAPGARQRRPPTHYTPIADRYQKQKIRKAVESTTASDRSESRSGKVSDDGRISKTKDTSDQSIRVDSPGKEGFRMPDVVPKHFEELFRKARMNALEKIPTVSADYDGSLPPKIQLGNKKIVTWYTSPFPEEYIRCQCLYLCEFCLQYMKTVKVLKSHYEKCPWHRPPGTDIYHDVVMGEDGDGNRQELVLYETDGNEWKEYCQNLCLLAKLYLDHKTLYYDVEPFLFYVLTSRDKYGDHLIGYFSKEKNCPQRYNVSCIMILPPYQGGGYGRFLIDFSYLLSRVEGQHGTPEKPLSELGQLSYHAYWRSAILDFFLEQRQKSSTKTSIKAICDATGMWPQDVADMLQQLNFLVKKEDSNAWEFSLVPDVLDAYFEKRNSGKKRLPLHPDKLQWDPWRGDGMGVTSGDSDHGESHTDMQLDTNDEKKDGHRSRDTSESDKSQKLTARREKSVPASPPASLSAVRKSREKTPRGRPSHGMSSSKEPSPAQEPHSSEVKRGQGRTSRQDKTSPRTGRTSVISSRGSRRKRKIKIRSGRSSSTKQATASQPKNYKGRGEEFRAGAEKRRKRRQRQQRGNSSSGSSSSPYRRSPSTTSLSSADESLASGPSYNKHQGNFPRKQTAKNDDSESTTSKSSSSSALSHLDQPPRAPHPQQQIDMMDQGVCNDSPPEFHSGQLGDASTAHHKSVSHHAAELSVQTEPLDAIINQAPVPLAPVIHRQHDYQRERDIVPVEINVHGRALENPGTVQQPLPQVHPTSPSFPSHLSQPTTPYPVGSPLVSHGSVGQPGSVVSSHELMSQDSEIMMNPPSYESTSYEHHYTPQSAPAVPATPPTYPAYPPNSPAVTQPLHASVYPSEISHQAGAQQVAYGDMNRGAPHTPGGSSQSAAYHHEESTSRPFVQDTPHSPRVMPNSKYAADAYARAASVAPRYVVDPSTIRSQSVAPSNTGQRQLHTNPYSEAVAQETASYSAAMYTKPQTNQTSSSSTARKHRRQADTSGQAQISQHHHMQAMQQSTHPLMFHSPYSHGPSGMMMGFPGMTDSVPMGAYASAMQQEPSSLSKLNEFTRNIPSAGTVPNIQYGQHSISGQRTQANSALSRQQQMSHHMPMAVSGGALPMQYNIAGMKNMQNFAGQPPVMSPGYQAAFFGQPLPGQPAGYRPAPAQSLYPAYHYVYPPGGPQHGSHGQGSLR